MTGVREASKKVPISTLRYEKHKEDEKSETIKSK